MARIDYARREDLSGEMVELFDRFASYGPFANLVGAMANRPLILRHVFAMLVELREEDVLPRRYLEIALVVVSQLNAPHSQSRNPGPNIDVVRTHRNSILVDAPIIDISASFVRSRIANGQSVEYLIPEAVMKIISEKKLYQ